MAYKVIKGKNKIRGEQTFVDTISGSIISASSYIGATFSGSTGLFTTLTASVISASNFIGIPDTTPKGPEYSLQFNSGSTFSGSAGLTFNYTTSILSGTTAQYTIVSGSQITGSNIKTTTLSASYISASQITLTEYLDFNTAATVPTYAQGRLFYNANTQDPAFYTSVTGVSINLGQQTAVKVKNSSGIVITKGKLVHIVGGAGANPLIATASWENDNNSANTLGMAMNDMNQNDFGFVLLNGVIEGIDTQGYTAGQIVYLSSSGNYTGTKPQAPLHAVKIGEIVRVQQNNGSMFVNIANGQEMEELHDVRVTSASAGDLLTYSSYNGTPLWVNTKTLSGSYVITGSLTISSSATFTNIGPAIFSGNINSTNTISGTTGQFTYLTASVISASSIVGVSLSVDTGSLLTTASVSNATITFSKGNGTTFPITVNNVVTAQTASYVLNAVSASFATTASFAANAVTFPFSGSAVITGSLTLTGSAGTTIFSSTADTIVFTGSLFTTGSVILTGTLDVSGSITGNLFGTSSFATNCLTASFIDGGFY